MKPFDAILTINTRERGSQEEAKDEIQKDFRMTTTPTRYLALVPDGFDNKRIGE